MMEHTRPFIHLHVHSHYSLLDGAGTLSALVGQAKSFGMDSLALTDHGNLFGALKFYKEAKKQGIKPIVGYEAYVAPGSRFGKESGVGGKTNYHLTLLAENIQGYKNLLKLASLAYMEGFYYKPRIDRALLKKYHEGLICLSGCLGGEINQYLTYQDVPNLQKAEEVALWYRELFGDRYYLEIQNNGVDLQYVATKHMLEMSKRLGIPTVATSDVHYVKKEDAEVQDILLCVNTGKLRTEPNRMRMEPHEYYMRSQEEMYAAFPGQEESVARSAEIALRCNLELELNQRFFPVYKTPEGVESVDLLREIALKGLRDRYKLTPKRWVDGKIGGELTPEVIQRLETELDTIKRQGFPNYFLIVWDFVREATERGIACTARGSGVGSLVCFGLGLSRVCPLEYDLLFERFLDVNRAEAPDIDIDFEQQRRGEILQYVKDKYGEENVAQIGTFGTMAAKAAINDVGRALGLTLAKVREVTSKVPDTPKMTIQKAMEMNTELMEMYQSDSDVQQLINFAKGCEGLARNAGTHACAVLITETPVTDYVPLHSIQGKDGVVTQWEYAEVEASGLLKMDFLGLRNLSILSQTMNLIEDTTGQKLNPYDFPQDDPETYGLISRGETKGVFQLESSGFRDLLQRLQPDNFRDIIAALALYRPGPLDGGMVDTYINVKHGRQKAEYIHPVVEEILKETYGVMVYQEQIMRILNRLGKIELADSYKCIKAISKKKETEITKYKQQFLEGCQENNLTISQGSDLFELIVKFAGYGFNKSHSTAYAKIAYITAYLKMHYPVEFMAALLTGDISQRNFASKDTTVEHLEDCKRMNIEVTGPDVNTCGAGYRVEKYMKEDGTEAKRIYFALNAIKGCGDQVAAAIREERLRGGPFKDIFDFCERLDSKIVPRAVILVLIRAGAFDCFGVKRAQLDAVVDHAIQSGTSAANDRAKGQMSLFDVDDEMKESMTASISLPNIAEWPERELLKNEKEVLGFYRSSNPLAEYAGLLRKFCSHTTQEGKLLKHRTQVMIGGMISGLKLANTKNPKPGDPSRYAMFDLDDDLGVMRTICWPKQYEKYADLIQQDAVIACVGFIDKRTADDEATFIVDKIYCVEDLKIEFTEAVSFVFKENVHTPNTVQTLKEILRSYPGAKKVKFIVDLEGNQRIILDSKTRVAILPEMLRRVTELLGKDSMHFLTLKFQPKEPAKYGNWKKRKYDD
ncbi:MAG: DNA polymerase III subunit alpha [Planctomycetia bacterium]|nr:DNA polymerase III subunit alpha [Planctomycetia bacterium]